MSNFVPQETREKIAALVQANTPLRTIAAECGVSKGTVGRYQRKTISVITRTDKFSKIESDDAGTAAAILARGPKYLDGIRFKGLHWRDAEYTELRTLCDAKADIERTADVLGRGSKSIAWKATEIGPKLPPQWNRLIVPAKIRDVRIQLAYPYIIKPRDEHADLLAVNTIVPQGPPCREDICQEIMLALWEKRITLNDLIDNREDVRAFIRSFKKGNYEMGGYAISLDVPMYDGRSWHDVLAAPEPEVPNEFA